MDAVEILRQKDEFPDGTIREMVIYLLPNPVQGSLHPYKYRFFFGTRGERLIGYDNERGKGDHRHKGGAEEQYQFQGLAQLIRDFASDIDEWRAAHADADDHR